MKKLIFLFAMIFAVSMAMGQATLDLDQESNLNYADITQVNGGGETSTIIDQVAVTSNDVLVDQASKSSEIVLNQTAGTTNDADIKQYGSGDNQFFVDQIATTGYNTATLYLGPLTKGDGWDFHDNYWDVDQTASGNNDLTITLVAKKAYPNNGNWGIDIDQTATAGDNYTSIVMDGQGGPMNKVGITVEQTSQDNYLVGSVTGSTQMVDVDITQDGFVTNRATFATHGSNIVLTVDQNSALGSNELISYQEGNSTAIVYQNAHSGGNTYANVNQIK